MKMLTSTSIIHGWRRKENRTHIINVKKKWQIYLYSRWHDNIPKKLETLLKVTKVNEKILLHG